MSLTGVYFDPALVDQNLIATLADDHIDTHLAPEKIQLVKPFKASDVWLAVDSTYPAQIAERFRLLQERQDYFIDRVEGDQEVRAAEHELREKVIYYMLARYPEYFSMKDGNVVCALTGMVIKPEAEPMVAVALLASEDLILMMPAELGTEEKQSVYRLKSGVLAFNNDWSLRSKFNAASATEAEREISLKKSRLGRSLREIHEPRVKHYMKHFLHPVDNFFNSIRTDAFYWRRNWAATMDADLNQHPDIVSTPAPEMTLENFEKGGYIRSEHETFVKLPASNAVVFGIKTYLWPITEIMKHPAAVAAFFKANDNLSAEMREYHKDDEPVFTKFVAKHRAKVGL